MSGEEDQPREFEADLLVLERNKLLRYAALAMAFGGPLAFVGFTLGIFPPGVMGFHLTIIGLVLLLTQARHNTRAKRREAKVRVTPEGVEVDGVLTTRRDQISDGFFQPRAFRVGRFKVGPDYRSSIRLVDKRRRIIFEAETVEIQAREMLRVLRLDAGSKRAEFRGASPLYATHGRQLGWALGAIAASFAFGIVSAWLRSAISEPLLVFMLPIMLIGVMPSKITVGIDAILVKWLWTKKFIPMSTIRHVLPDGDTRIRLVLTTGEEEMLYVATDRKNQRQLGEQHRDAVLARIEEALAAFKARGPVADVTALLSRGSRSKDEWLDALQKLRNNTGEGGYRQAVVRNEDLFRVLENPAAPEDARAGAALVLRDALDDEGRARIRVAAGAIASPKLRVALDAAVSPTDGLVEEAVGELAPEGKERAAS